MPPLVPETTDPGLHAPDRPHAGAAVQAAQETAAVPVAPGLAADRDLLWRAWVERSYVLGPRTLESLHPLMAQPAAQSASLVPLVGLSPVAWRHLP